MSEENSIINLDGVHNTLIDINGTISYFTSKVVVTPSAENMSTPYKVGIVSQDELDSGNMNLKEHIGIFSNMITKDSGEFQNLFLYLNSSQPMKDVSVSVITEEIERPPPPPAAPAVEVIVEQQNTNVYSKILLALIIIVIGSVVLRKFYNERS